MDSPPIPPSLDYMLPGFVHGFLVLVAAISPVGLSYMFSRRLSVMPQPRRRFIIFLLVSFSTFLSGAYTIYSTPALPPLHTDVNRCAHVQWWWLVRGDSYHLGVYQATRVYREPGERRDMYFFFIGPVGSWLALSYETYRVRKEKGGIPRCLSIMMILSTLLIGFLTTGLYVLFVCSYTYTYGACVCITCLTAFIGILAVAVEFEIDVRDATHFYPRVTAVFDAIRRSYWRRLRRDRHPGRFEV